MTELHNARYTAAVLSVSFFIMSHSDRLPQFDSEEPTEDELIRLEEQSLQAIKKYSDRIPSIPPDPLETQREKIREKAAQILLIIQMNGVEDQLSAHDVLGFDVSLFPHED
ncbi:MAG: hypothetical protein U1C97_00100, partial [Candidatus Gracilibacteria bacterium]|nr:hypothetical protein [Candidatus Gracilibacteria bacterium]